MNNQFQQRQGTILIMCVGVIVLMVSLATAYIKSVSAQRGTGFRQSVNIMAKRAARSGQAHVVRTLLKEYSTLESANSYSCDKTLWRSEFIALEGTDNLPVMDWERNENPARGSHLSGDVNVNSSTGRIIRTIQIWGGGYNGGGMDAIFGAQADITRPVARWYNVYYLD